MRKFLVAAVAACALASPALAAEARNFSLATTRDLVALCSGQPDSPLYSEALQFCYGYMAGVAQLHRVLVRSGDLKPATCPRYEVTREGLVRIFLEWARANPHDMDARPAESVKRAAVAAWPCGR